MPGWAADAVLLATSVLVALALLWRTLHTGEDIPGTWASLIGLVWGALLGIRELVRRGNGKGNGG